MITEARLPSASPTESVLLAKGMCGKVGGVRLKAPSARLRTPEDLVSAKGALGGKSPMLPCLHPSPPGRLGAVAAGSLAL